MSWQLFTLLSTQPASICQAFIKWHLLCNQSFIDGHLNCFQAFAITNKLQRTFVCVYSLCLSAVFTVNLLAE